MAARKRKIPGKAKPSEGQSKASETSKQQFMIEMLRRPEGETIEQMSKTFGWQAHTVRGALSGALKKKRGLKVLSDKVEGGERVYRIA